MGNWRRTIDALLIRALSGKNSRLTEVPFWNYPEGTFHFITRMPYRRIVPHPLNGFPVTGLRNTLSRRRNSPAATPASGDDSKNLTWRGFCSRSFLVFVTFQ